MNSIKSVSEFIFSLEKEKKLFERKINDINYWKIIRFPLFFQITKQLGLYGVGHPPVSKKDGIKILIKSQIAAFKQLFDKKKTDVIVFSHMRKKEYKGRFCDIYSVPIIEEMNKKNKNYEIWSFSNYGEFKSKEEKLTPIYSIFNYFKIAIRKQSIMIPDDEMLKIQELQKIIFDELEIKIDLLKIVRAKLATFEVLYKTSRRLLEVKRPKKIYIVVAYMRDYIVKAAQDMGIEVIEIQHGVMSPYHLGYSFPEINNVPYFPNKLMLFGKYWYNSTPLPIEEKNVEYIGFEYFKDNISQMKQHKKKNQILVLSQGIISERLAEFVYEYAKANKKQKILYRLHPSEKKYMNNYKYFQKLFKLKNVNIDSNESIYDSANESKYVMGVFSTAIFEAIYLKCIPILVDLPGVEYMDYIIKKYNLRVCKNKEDVTYNLNNKNILEIWKEKLF